MNSNLIFDFTVDKANKQIHVKREFAAPVQKVWSAWTDSKILDQWWAPKPFKAVTKSQEFKVGGTWLYAMVGPDFEHWCRADYKTIDVLKSYTGLDAFCDENGNINMDFPRMSWDVSFTDKGTTTIVDIKVSYDKLEDLEKIIEMGFKEGFTAGLGNLDELLAAS
ncbi:MAG: SRPBCC domain-containing protein [Bacteroidota bacterium]